MGSFVNLRFHGKASKRAGFFKINLLILFYIVVEYCFGIVHGFIRYYNLPGVEELVSKIGGVDLVRRSMVAASLVLISLAFMAGISVVGLLQSTERVGSSGIIVQPPPPPPPSPPPSPPPPPEPTIEIDVYSDSACTQVKSSVEWGEIVVGGSASDVVFIKNSGDEGVILSFIADNWDPPEVADYMQLSWDYDGSTIDPGAVIELTLTLAVDSSISGIDNFSFDIILTGSVI